MVSFIEQISAGNALRVFVQPPAGAVRWRVLRASSSAIPAFDFAGAAVVLDGDDASVLDTDQLVNATPVWYRAFYLMADGSWQATPAKSAVPASTFINHSCDVVEVVRARLDAGFAALVARAEITPDAGFIPVLIASPQFEGARFPLVTVHLGSDGPGERGVGESFGADEASDDGIFESEGWLSRVLVTVMVWSLNVDERKLMRRLLKAVLMANLGVFDDAGMVQIDLTFSDQDDFASYPAPLYQVAGTLSCLAPSSIATRVPVVADVQIQML